MDGGTKIISGYPQEEKWYLNKSNYNYFRIKEQSMKNISTILNFLEDFSMIKPEFKYELVFGS